MLEPGSDSIRTGKALAENRRDRAVPAVVNLLKSELGRAAPLFDRGCVAGAAVPGRAARRRKPKYRERNSATAHCTPVAGWQAPVVDGYLGRHARLSGFRHRHCRRAGDIVCGFLCHSRPTSCDAGARRRDGGQAARRRDGRASKTGGKARTDRQATGRQAPGAGAATAASVPPVDIAVDARQQPLMSNAQLRRLADKERARRLAYREGSSFETRFLHYDD